MHLRLSYDKITDKVSGIVWTDQRSILATDTRLNAFLA